MCHSVLTLKPFNSKHNILFCFDVGILINQINSQFEKNPCYITSHKKHFVHAKFILNHFV